MFTVLYLWVFIIFLYYILFKLSQPKRPISFLVESWLTQWSLETLVRGLSVVWWRQKPDYRWIQEWMGGKEKEMVRIVVFLAQGSSNSMSPWLCVYAQLGLTLWDPNMDCRLSGSSVHGIFHARMLEWVPCPTPGDLPNPGIKSASLALAGEFFTTRASWEAHLPSNLRSFSKSCLLTFGVGLALQFFYSVIRGGWLIWKLFLSGRKRGICFPLMCQKKGKMTCFHLL